MSSLRGNQSRCGRLFKEGDLVYNCKTCQTDGTCVLCQDCFDDSNHEGHVVTFHKVCCVVLCCVVLCCVGLGWVGFDICGVCLRFGLGLGWIVCVVLLVCVWEFLSFH